MIQIVKHPGQRVLELGGGDNPHPTTDVNVDVRGGPKVSFTADFDRPLPIGSDEFDAVLCFYALEHVSYRNVVAFLAEVHRVTKPGGTIVFTIPDTEEQVKWIAGHPDGWDGRDFFSSSSGLLFGDQDYSENSHKCYFTKTLASQLFRDAGFETVIVSPWGERQTDILIRALKKNEPSPELRTIVERLQTKFEEPAVVNPVVEKVSTPYDPVKTASNFDKHYFNGGGKVGGYSREGYRDFPVHHVTAKHVLDRRPESVLELGCARGYVLKKIQDSGKVPGECAGMEVSRHCWMTRCCDHVALYDSCLTPWGIYTDKQFDLCYSIAFLEHVPEDRIDDVIREMKRVSKRGLHGVDFGENDDGFDQTHCTLKPREWWIAKFRQHDYPCEVVDKEELETGAIPPEVLCGDGTVKLNVGSFTTMFHHGWTNVDVHDLRQFAAQEHYNFLQWDVRNGLPFRTGDVSAIVASHFLEHLTYERGLSFLRECRRVLDPKRGAMRLQVPDAGSLTRICTGNGNPSYFDEINDGCARARTSMAKLYSLLCEGHSAFYDSWTLIDQLHEAGFEAKQSSFRETCKEFPGREMFHRIHAETLDTFPCLTLYVNAIPRT